jgi:hypothetical protein
VRFIRFSGFYPNLRKAFANLLGIGHPDDLVIPDHPELLPAMGAAMVRNGKPCRGRISNFLSISENGISHVTNSGTKRLPSLFAGKCELKTDMDIERLPSGRFASNSVVPHLAMVTYNALRIIGRQSLEEARRRGIKLPGSRPSKHVERRRIRTVIQDLMYMAGRLIYRGRQWYIGFGCLNPFAELWRLIDSRLRGASA